MVKKVMAIAAVFVMIAALCACGSEPVSAQTYEYCGKKDNEGYHVEGTMVVSDGVIQSMEWKIVDDYRNRVFDEAYEEVYTGIPLYIQQCKDNWSGMQTFVPALIETQDLDEVDSVSGATWAYLKFKEAAKALLEQAKK